MFFFYILGVAIALVISYFVADEFKSTAELKGYNGTKYFWFTFLFGIVGMLMVIALPDKRKTNQNTVILANNDSSEAKTEKVLAETPIKDKTTHRWRCDSCGNMRTQSPCEFCEKE